MPPIDVDRVRAETPGCAQSVHLNNAGSSLLAQPVIDAVVDYFREESVRGGYETAAAHDEDIAGVYDSVAALIGANREEIALVESATRAWELVFTSIPMRAGDHIVTAKSEYASNVIGMLQATRRLGVVIDVIDDDEHGQIDVNALGDRLDQLGTRARLVCVGHVPTHSGLVNPVERVGALTQPAGVPLLLDACQSIGQIDVDVDAIGCDFVAASGRKYLRAPRGTGFLYVRRERLAELDVAFVDMRGATWIAPDHVEIHDDARRFERWEANLAARRGLGVAIDYARRLGIDAIAERVSELASTLRSALAEIAGVRVHDRGQRLCGITTFTVEGWTSDDVVAKLRAAGINMSVSRPEFARFHFSDRDLPALVRASVHYYNDEGDLTRAVSAISALAASRS